MTIKHALTTARSYVKGHTQSEGLDALANEEETALWAVDTVEAILNSEHDYSLAELRNGTGFPRGARFIMIG